MRVPGMATEAASVQGMDARRPSTTRSCSHSMGLAGQAALVMADDLVHLGTPQRVEHGLRTGDA